jgi:hypothetical protein
MDRRPCVPIGSKRAEHSTPNGILAMHRWKFPGKGFGMSFHRERSAPVGLLLGRAGETLTCVLYCRMSFGDRSALFQGG